MPKSTIPNYPKTRAHFWILFWQTPDDFIHQSKSQSVDGLKTEVETSRGGNYNVHLKEIWQQ